MYVIVCVLYGLLKVAKLEMYVQYLVNSDSLPHTAEYNYQQYEEDCPSCAKKWDFQIWKLVEGFKGREDGASGLHCDIAPDELRLDDVDLFFLPVLFQDLHAIMREINLLGFTWLQWDRQAVELLLGEFAGHW